MSQREQDADTVYHVEDADGEVLPHGRYRNEMEARDRWHKEGGHAEGPDGVTVEEYDRNEHRLYSVREENITVVDGMEIDIEVRQQIAGDERDCDRVWSEVRDHIGLLAQALEEETPPSEIVDRDDDKRPSITVDWETVFDDGGDE